MLDVEQALADRGWRQVADLVAPTVTERVRVALRDRLTPLDERLLVTTVEESRQAAAGL